MPWKYLWKLNWPVWETLMSDPKLDNVKSTRYFDTEAASGRRNICNRGAWRDHISSKIKRIVYISYWSCMSLLWFRLVSSHSKTQRKAFGLWMKVIPWSSGSLSSSGSWRGCQQKKNHVEEDGILSNKLGVDREQVTTFKKAGFCTSTYSTSTQKNFICHPDPVMYEDPKSAKILVLGDSVLELWPKNRFWAIFGSFLGFLQNHVKFIWL